MPVIGFSAKRRKMIKMMAWAALGAVTGPIDRVLAMGVGGYPQGMRKLQGQVQINGLAAKLGDEVKVGDTIVTGADGLAIFVIGKDSYLLRADTRLELSAATEPTAKAQIVEIIHLARGKMLAVFGRGQKRIVTETMVAGVRGTGLYAETESDRTYLCTCYGTVVLEPKGFPQGRQELRTTHHEKPRYIYSASQHAARIEPAPMKNHTDKELTLLESMVRRRPPFASSKDNNGGGGGY